MNKNKKRRFAPGQKIPKTYGRAGNISKEESDAMLEEALAQLFSATHRSDPADRKRAKQPDKILVPALEGDGEEVFGQMVDDLLCMASLVDGLYSILVSLADRRVCQKLALKQGGELLREADAILERWQRYSLPEA